MNATQGELTTPDNPLPRTTLIAAVTILNVLLFATHLAQDIVYGYEKGTLGNYPAVLMMLAALYGALVLAGRRSGLVILLLFSLLCSVFPIAHMRGAGLGAAVAKRGVDAGFIGAQILIGVTGLFAAGLSAQGIWRSFRKPRP